MSEMVTRRDAMKLIGCAGALALGASEVRAAAVSPSKWDDTVDVLVVGAGGSGLMAAVTVKEKSPAKNVLVVEKASAAYMNNTAGSTGIFNAAGSRLQAEKGQGKEDILRFEKELIGLGHGACDDGLVKIFAHNSGQTIDWLAAHGVKYRLSRNAAFSKLTAHACDRNSGSQYIEILLKEAKKLGVKVRYETRALELVTDPGLSKVLGVKVSVDGHKGSRFIRVRKAVVLSTGGFGGNPTMIDSHLPNFKGAITCSSVMSRGEGLLMATRIGAGTTHMGQVGMYAYGVPGEGNRRGLIFRGHIMNLSGSITVGPNGRRFIADEAQQNDVASAMVYHGFRKVYTIANQKQIDEFMKAGSQVISWNPERFRKELDENKVFCKKANTIEELAVKLGMDPKVLRETVDRYNGFVRGGKDKDFGRRFMNGTFEKGPFYAFEGSPLVVETTGGLKTDSNLQVLDVEGKPIAGLYACGAVLGGGHGTGYVGGNPVGIAMTTGRYAGLVVGALK